MFDVGTPVRRPDAGPWWATLEAAWYAGLVLLLAVDIALRNVDGDLPTALVLAIWSVAFAVPFVVLSVVRRRST